jgi:uroporphyrin-III C-methyltransferase / precorrin-2 dehydrogenase / sirohydrochlorin ferrochelatase
MAGYGGGVMTGSVILVGAGPGDPELLTLAAVRALQSADVILHDDLVSAEVLAFAKTEARKMLVGKRGGRPSASQRDIEALMVGLARQGKVVARLKGGDPMLFGRADEEIAACTVAGIPVRVIPGITAMGAAAAAIGRSLTGRGTARKVEILTGHDQTGTLPEAATPAQTTRVVYMPKASAAAHADQMIAEGWSPATPMAFVISASRPDQRIVSGSLSQAGDLARQCGSEPALMLVGAIARDLANRDAGAAQDLLTQIA